MAAGQAFSGNIERLFAPQGWNVVVAPDKSLAPPQDEERAADSLVGVGGIVHQVDAGGGAVVVAATADRLGVGEAPNEFADDGGVKCLLVAHAPARQTAFQTGGGVGGDHAFRQRGG